MVRCEWLAKAARVLCRTPMGLLCVICCLAAMTAEVRAVVTDTVTIDGAKAVVRASSQPCTFPIAGSESVYL